MSEVSNFPTKLWSILSNPEFNHIISWMPNGCSWKIHQPQLFVDIIMPRYFENQSDISSFMRQVNAWGFRKVLRGDDKDSYYNSFFTKEQPQMIRTMRRRSLDSLQSYDKPWEYYSLLQRTTELSNIHVQPSRNKRRHSVGMQGSSSIEEDFGLNKRYSAIDSLNGEIRYACSEPLSHLTVPLLKNQYDYHAHIRQMMYQGGLHYSKFYGDHYYRSLGYAVPDIQISHETEKLNYDSKPRTTITIENTTEKRAASETFDTQPSSDRYEPAYHSQIPDSLHRRNTADDHSQLFSTPIEVSLEDSGRANDFDDFTCGDLLADDTLFHDDFSMTISSSSSVGILIVGLGGANGSTLAAGILANRRNLKWYGARGESMSANYNGCITQLAPRGTHQGVGYKGKYPGDHYQLADANEALVGGWDIRPAKLGDALLDAQILDYDLVRQLRDELNQLQILKGYYDPRYIGSSQHEGATYTIDRTISSADVLELLRRDIRNFKREKNITGHTTVIWSASVEPNCSFCFPNGGLDTADELLKSIQMTEEERGGPLPPSLIYATAAILEGCSFINGGSQYTLCSGLTELTQKQQGVYCLGTDFKAGQTKFKTAAVEYLRTMGLEPKVIASSNHLGNNDMCNLASSDTARMAKLRVKNDIFSTWGEDIDHKVSVMYCKFINDEKRDFVEYTSLAFLNQTHTMVTYTRASDSVLCVPLMIDAAVWCDFFSVCNWPLNDVAKALAYLFKVPEGAANGVDPGFFRQMRELDDQVQRATTYLSNSPDISRKREAQRSRMASCDLLSSIISPIMEESRNSGWTIHGASSIICAGLACVDMQLLSASRSDNGSEAIESFCGEKTTGGGSVSMASKTLSRMTHSSHRAVFHKVIPICKIGSDDSGDKLLQLFHSVGVYNNNLDTFFIERARTLNPDTRTALAVLPIYQDGKRGCFFDAASNKTFSSCEMIGLIDEVTLDQRSGRQLELGAFLFGYPHLLPMMQGQGLHDILLKARLSMQDGGLVAVDLNGLPKQHMAQVSSSIMKDPVLGPAFRLIDILHLNEEELLNLTGLTMHDNEVDSIKTLSHAADLILESGVAIVIVTLGARGSLAKCNNGMRFDQSRKLPSSWAGTFTKVNAAHLEKESVINCNGAGDAFTSGFILSAMLRRKDSVHTLTIEVALHLASLVAARHVCISSRDCGYLNIDDLLDVAFSCCSRI